MFQVATKLPAFYSDGIDDVFSEKAVFRCYIYFLQYISPAGTGIFRQLNFLTQEISPYF
jgi:hypothetical protein